MQTKYIVQLEIPNSSNLSWISEILEVTDTIEYEIIPSQEYYFEGYAIIMRSYDYTNLTQNRNVVVTEQFLQECANQVYKDFYGEK